MTSRLALDRLRRIAARRESYIGEWLPEPVDTDGDPTAGVLMAETVSYGLLVVLETLSPIERVVYVLREAFGHSHAEIAAMLDRSEEAIRQASSRARAHVRERSSRFRPDHETARIAADRFLDAAAGGDLGPFLALLAPDVELVADSGGKVRAPAAARLRRGKVTRFLEAILQRGAPEAAHDGRRSLNGSPAVVVRIAGDRRRGHAARRGRGPDLARIPRREPGQARAHRECHVRLGLPRPGFDPQNRRRRPCTRHLSTHSPRREPSSSPRSGATAPASPPP